MGIEGFIGFLKVHTPKAFIKFDTIRKLGLRVESTVLVENTDLFALDTRWRHMQKANPSLPPPFVTGKDIVEEFRRRIVKRAREFSTEHDRIRVVITFDDKSRVPSRKGIEQARRIKYNSKQPYAATCVSIDDNGIKCVDPANPSQFTYESVDVSRMMCSRELSYSLLDYLTLSLRGDDMYTDRDGALVPNTFSSPWFVGGVKDFQTAAHIYVDQGTHSGGPVRCIIEKEGPAEFKRDIAAIKDTPLNAGIGEAELALHLWCDYLEEEDKKDYEKKVITIVDKSLSDFSKEDVKRFQLKEHITEEVSKTLIKYLPQKWYLICSTDTDGILVAILKYWDRPDVCFVKFDMSDKGVPIFFDVAEAILSLKKEGWQKENFFVGSVMRGCDYYSRGHAVVSTKRVPKKRHTADQASNRDIRSFSTAITDASETKTMDVDTPRKKGKDDFIEYDDAGCLMGVNPETITTAALALQEPIFDVDLTTETFVNEKHVKEGKERYERFIAKLRRLASAKAQKYTVPVNAVDSSFRALLFLLHYIYFEGYKNPKSYACTAFPDGTMR
jgi:hypothetical protein